MKNGIKKYLVFAKAGFQTLIAYRGNVVLWAVGAIISGSLMGLLWWAIYSYSDSGVIAGFTFPQMLLYVILSAAVAQTTQSTTMSNISDDVRDGNIGMRLMKPISYRLQLLFQSFGTFLGRVVLFCVPTAVIGTLIAVFGFGLGGLKWYNVALFFVAIILAFFVNEGLDFIIGQFAFRTQAMFGVKTMYQVISAFLSGLTVPLALFPLWAQNVLNFTPFPFMASMPIKLFLGVMSVKEILFSFLIALLWIILINVLGKIAYTFSIKKIVVFGG